jgi:hypothetical protein
MTEQHYLLEKGKLTANGNWKVENFLNGSQMSYYSSDIFYFEDEKLESGKVLEMNITPPKPVTFDISWDFVNKVTAQTTEKLRDLSDQNYKARYKDHIVKKGETVYSISKLYNITQQALIKENSINNLEIIEGRTLRIPLKKKVN